MNQVKIKQDESGIFHIYGELSFHTVQRLLGCGEEFFRDANEIKINFTEVTHCDSAGLALLIEWKRFAEKSNKTIQFQSLSKQLLNMAKISGFGEML